MIQDGNNFGFVPSSFAAPGLWIENNLPANILFHNFLFRIQ